MQLSASRVVLTGATGGIGESLANELLARGARVCLVGRNLARLQALQDKLAKGNREVCAVAADLASREGIETVHRESSRLLGGVDILINNAGTSAFVDFVHQDAAEIEHLFRVNVVAPLQLTRALLPDMIDRGSGQIVNIGSTFGTIGFACFSGYSATKFALRGFSEALRREICDQGIKVTYVAPRAVRTRANSAAVYRMADAVKMNMDEPGPVARKIVDAIAKDRKDVYLGFPESLFARINSLFPRLVDKALAKQNRVMRDYARTA